MIRFERFTKAYDRHVAVRDFSFAVEPGEVVALLGPNGSGKTTCLKAAAGLIHPSSGGVRLGNPPVSSSAPEGRKILSFLPQRVTFPETLTGYEVVEFYRQLRGVEAARTEAVLRFSCLLEASARPVGTYSGGMAQRLGLAVAALPEAPVLLLDEPTAALDPDGLRAFYDLVEDRRSSGKAVLFTTHHLDDVLALADRFALLVEGRLATILSATEITERLAAQGGGPGGTRMKLEGLYRELVGAAP